MGRRSAGGMLAQGRSAGWFAHGIEQRARLHQKAAREFLAAVDMSDTTSDTRAVPRAEQLLAVLET